MDSSLMFGAAALFAALAIHPFVIYPLTLRFVARPDRAAPPAMPTPASYAICMCAYNEEAVIERKVANLLALREAMGRLDILVYVDAASDRTAALLAPYQDRITLIVSPERYGKTHGMNALVRLTDAEVVLFTDANVMIDAAAVAAMGEAFRDPRVGCVCGHLVYTNGEETPTAGVGSLYWRLEEEIKRRESAYGAAMGADGSLFAIRRVLHQPVPPDLIDDFYLSLSILCDGHRVVSAPAALAYESQVTDSREEFRRKVRIACQAVNVHRRLWPRLRRLPPALVYMYLSHKVMRWLSLYALAAAGGLFLGGVLAAGVPALAVGAMAAGGAAALGFAARRRVPPIAQVAEILLALAGAAIGVAASLRGRRFTTWTPASSIRRAG